MPRVHSISFVDVDAKPESECWSQLVREMVERFEPDQIRHIGDEGVLGFAALEKGMRSGAPSVMLHVDAGDRMVIVELSLDALETITLALRAGCDARGWSQPSKGTHRVLSLDNEKGVGTFRDLKTGQIVTTSWDPGHGPQLCKVGDIVELQINEKPS